MKGYDKFPFEERKQYEPKHIHCGNYWDFVNDPNGCYSLIGLVCK